MTRVSFANRSLLDRWKLDITMDYAKLELKTKIEDLMAFLEKA